MADGVKVDLEALTTFAQRLSGAADGHIASSGGDRAAIAAVSQYISTGAAADGKAPQSCPGPRDFVEAQNFADRHGAMNASVQRLLSDAVDGLGALSIGAATCATRYADTDAANAALLRQFAGGASGRLFSLFTPALTGQGAITAATVNDTFDPKSPGEAMFGIGGGSETPATDDRNGGPATTKTVPGALPSDEAFLAEIAQTKGVIAAGGSTTGPPADQLGTAPFTVSITNGDGTHSQIVIPADAGQMPSVNKKPGS